MKPLTQALFLLCIAVVFTEVSAGGCSCTCPAGVQCTSGCKTCLTYKPTCDCWTGCSSGGCHSGYSEVDNSYCFWEVNYDEKCRRTNCPTVPLGYCLACSEGFYGSGCTPCPGGGGSSQCGGSSAGTCNDGISGNGKCQCNSGYAGNACQYSRASTCSGHGNPTSSGGCNCDQGFTGTTCSKCASNYYAYPTCKYCTRSLCNYQGTCSSSGNCNCYARFSGSRCEKCLSDHYNYPTCKYCKASSSCSGQGICDSKGDCSCDAHHTGTKCNACVAGYYANSGTGWNCRQCPGGGNCNGADHGTCNSGWGGTGLCTCKGPYRGPACVDPSIIAVTPSDVNTEGGTQIAISGWYFGTLGGNSKVEFLLPGGNKECVVVTWSAIVITCKAPAGQGYSFNIRVTRSDSVTSNDWPFSYAKPSISSTGPQAGPVVGGTDITIVGNSLGTSGGAVKWTDAQNTEHNIALTQQGVYNSQTKVSTVKFKSPAGMGPGNKIQYCLTVSGSTRCSGTVDNAFAYDPPFISLVSPTSGGTAGTYPVTLTGGNLGPAGSFSEQISVSVTIGGSTNPATILSQDRADDTLKISMPAGVGTSVKITLSMSSWLPTYATSTSVFSYEGPTIQSMLADAGSPACSVDNGVLVDCPVTPPFGYRITLVGQNFGDANDLNLVPVTITVGGKPCLNPVIVIAHAQMSCELPAGSRRNRPVVISRSGYSDAILATGVSYQGPFISDGTLKVSGGPDVGGIVDGTSNAGGDLLEFQGSFPDATLSNTIVIIGSPTRQPADPTDASFLPLYNPAKGQYNCSVTIATTSKLTCRTSPGVGAGLGMQVFVDNIPSNIGGDRFSYPVPTILSPSLRKARPGGVVSYSVNGDTTEGELIQFSGTYFALDGFVNADVMAVKYGPDSDPTRFTCSISVSSSSPELIQCRTAPGLGKDLRFIAYAGPAGGQAASARSNDTFSYPAAAVVTKVQGCSDMGDRTINCPTDGLSGGSAVVLTLTGEDFQDPNSVSVFVYIGNRPCTEVASVSGFIGTKLTCKLPVGAGVDQPVVVEQLSARSVGVPYVSYSIPIVERVSGCTPDPINSNNTIDCPRGGSHSITLTGTSFGASNAQVLVNAAPCSNVIHDPVTPHEKVTCTITSGVGLELSVILAQDCGSFSAANALLSYAKCPPGYYSVGEQTSCTECSLGKFTNLAGQSSCFDCPVGEIAPFKNQTTCTKCTAGKYMPNTGYSYCFSCNPGRFSPKAGLEKCDPCPVGTYSAVHNSSACLSCNSGKYQNSDGKSVCINCDPGKVTTTIEQSDCVSCDAGKYAPEYGSHECIRCGIGNVSESSSGSSACKRCDPGKYTNFEGLLSCIPCDAGKYNSYDGASECFSCINGTFSQEQGSTTCQECSVGSANAGVGEVSCPLCSSGRYAPDNASTTCLACPTGKIQRLTGQSSCLNCEIGTFQAGVGQVDCDICAPGTFQNYTGQSHCVTCDAGYWTASEFNGATVCSKCPVGRWSSAGQGRCTDCVPGRIADTMASTSCTPCGLGKFSLNLASSVCTNCSVGTYSSTSGSIQCLDCDLGSYAPTEGLSVCSLCDKGRHVGPGINQEGASTCQGCTIGRYMPDIGAFDCIDCSRGRFTDLTNRTECSPCNPGQEGEFLSGSTRCVNCTAGRYTGTSASALCIPCDVGTYTNKNGTSECTDCEAGRFQPAVGSTVCEKCPLGRASALTQRIECALCSKGRYANVTGLTRCHPCPIGRYMSGQGASICTEAYRGSFVDATAQETPSLCSPGEAVNVTGQTTCTKCDFGYATPSPGSAVCAACEVGKITGSQGLTSCSNCEAGSYTNRTAQSVCKSCETGRFQSLPGASKCDECGRGRYAIALSGLTSCAACAPGTATNDTAQTKCAQCALGFFQPLDGQVDCDPCPLGRFAASAVGQTECLLCEPGRFTNYTGAYGQCEMCPLGKFQDLPGKTSCDFCGRGTYAIAAPGQTECQDCAPGSFNNKTGVISSCELCGRGLFQNQPGQVQCLPCPVGTSAVNADGQTFCTDCAAGSFNNLTAQTTCFPCWAGSFQDLSGQTECLLCRVGTYDKKRSGASVCSDCEEGRFSATNGSTNCDPCQAGEYQSASGQSSCLDCPLGKSNKLLQQAICVDCEEGRFSNISGDTVCYPCAPGLFVATKGQSSCNQCPPGTFVAAYGFKACLPCPAGEAHNDTGRTFCDQCVPGRVAPSTGSTSCTNCSAGTYTNAPRLTACLDCNAGRVNNITGATTCEDCGLGYFQERPARRECVHCPIGRRGASKVGGTQCFDCGAGRYTDVPGLTECSACTPGTFQELVGQTVCQACPVGKRGQNLPAQSSCVACGVGTFTNVTGKTECTLCAHGKFQNRDGFTQCYDCEVGRYALPILGRSSCKDCEEGKKQNLTGQTSCDDCKIGSYQDQVKSTVCNLCELGRYSTGPGQRDCVACEAGRFTDSLGTSSQCRKCPAGTAQNAEGSSSCITCTPGTISDADGAKDCEACKPLTIMPSYGGTSCLSCDQLANSVNTECVCGRGFFNPETTPTNETYTVRCQECPKGADCEQIGTTKSSMGTLEGFWRADNDTLQFYRCLIPAHCDGGIGAGKCGSNREGVLCARCKDGYESNNGLSPCEPCLGRGASIGVSLAIITALGIAMIAIYTIILRIDRSLLQKEEAVANAEREWDKYDDALQAGIQRTSSDGAFDEVAKKEKQDTDDPQNIQYRGYKTSYTGKRKHKPSIVYKVKILFGFAQIILGLSFIPDIPWPAGFQEFISVFQFVNLDFVPWQSLGCVATLTNYEKILVVTLVPMATLLCLVLFYLLPNYYFDWKDMRDDDSLREARRRSRRKFWKLVLFTLFLMYPHVAQTVLGFFVCKDINGTKYLLPKLTLLCYDSRWMSFLGIVVFMTLLYPLGIPVIYFLLLFKYRHRFKEYGIRAQLGFLYEAYNPDMWYFELVDILNKLSLVALLPFLPTYWQMPGGMIVITLYQWVVLIKQPYVRSSDDRLAVFANCEIFLFLMAGYTLVDFEDKSGKLPHTADVAMTIILIGLFCALLLVFTLLLGKQIVKLYHNFQRARKRKKFKKRALRPTTNDMQLQLRTDASGKLVLENDGTTVGVVGDDGDGPMNIYARTGAARVSVSDSRGYQVGDSAQAMGQFHLNPMFVQRMAAEQKRQADDLELSAAPDVELSAAPVSMASSLVREDSDGHPDLPSVKDDWEEEHINPLHQLKASIDPENTFDWDQVNTTSVPIEHEGIDDEQ